MTQTIRSRISGCGVAVLAVVAATALMFVPAIGQGVGTPILIFLAAVWVSAWYGGLVPGLIATALCVILAHGPIDPPWRLIRLALFTTGGVLISVMNENLHAARRRAEAHAREAQAREERHRRIVETSDEGIWTVDAEGRTDFVNRRMAEMLGYDPGEMLGRPAGGFVDDRSRSDLGPILERLRRGEGGRFEVPLRRKDGSELWVTAAATPILGDGGEVRGALAMLTDVTERRRAERALRESRERLDLVLQSSQLGLWYSDLPFDRLVWNERCKEHFGLAPDATVTIETFFDRLHPEDRRRTREAIDRSIEDRTGYDLVYRTIAPDGRARRIRAIGRGFYDEAGTPIRFDGITVDVTEQYRVEERVRTLNADLRRRVGELQTLLDVAPVGIAVADDPECRQVLMNPHLAGLLGVGPEDGVDGRVTDGGGLPGVFVRAGEAVSAEELPMRIAVRSASTALAQECDVLRPDGTLAHLHVDAAPLFDEAGRVRGCLGIFLDVTDRRRAEAELVAAKEAAEAANRAKDRFLAVLSHELRTPLTPVLATVTAMLDEPETPAEMRPTLAMIRGRIELEARLIDDLLDVSRALHGKLRLERAPVDVHALLHQTIGICRSDLHGKRMRLELDLAASRPLVDADSARLQQVLWNLIKNAVKFTPQGGWLSIRTRNEAGDGQDGHLLVVELTDAGIGIEPDVLSRIFDAFEQGEDTVTRRFGGLGLGLAISRSIVEAHGGRLGAASAGQGQGATFTIELKAIGQGAVPGRDASPTVAASSPLALRILLVEDDQPSLRVMKRLLQQRGHEVSTADSIASGLEAGEAGEFDLIISDIGLPDGTGLDLMRQLRARRPVRGIALSGYGMDDDIRRSREAGFVEHLTKPVNFQTLETTIRRVASVPAL